MQAIQEGDRAQIMEIPGADYIRTPFPIPRIFLQWNRPKSSTSAATSKQFPVIPDAPSTLGLPPHHLPAKRSSDGNLSGLEERGLQVIGKKRRNK